MTQAVQAPRNTNAMAPKPQVSVPDAQKQTMTTIMNSLLDSEGYRKRFDELLGKRAPQFISSIISTVNADTALQKVFREAPITIIQCGLKAAVYDLPIDPSLGYAYMLPFTNNKKQVTEAVFVIGYRGMNQLALRTGAYKTINVVDVREGELTGYNRLTEEIILNFIEDEDERNKQKIVGWAGYFKLINGTEKTIYMSRKQVESHERKNRKGQYMGNMWRDHFDEMAEKTVFRRLIGRWGLMSIDYQKADQATIAAAEAIASGKLDDDFIETEFTVNESEAVNE